MTLTAKTILFRGISITAITMAVLSPKSQWDHSVKNAQIAVVWDASASMAETDTVTGKSRWAEAHGVWEIVQRTLPAATFAHFVLGKEARPVPDPGLSSDVPSEGECVLGSLGQVLTSSATRAILLFSDGRSSDPVKTFPGVPVFAIGVGGVGATPDLAVESIRAPPLAYAGHPVEVTARITSSVSSSSPVRVVLLENKKRRAQSSVTVSSGSAVVSFQFTPSRAGLSRCEIQAEPLPGETRTGNNARRFSMDVQRNRMRTLYIAGRPGPHYHFLRSQLKSDPSIELVSFVVLRDPEDLLAYADSELSLIPFPTSAALVAQLPTFDVVVLEEVPGVQIGLGESFYIALEKRVKAGGGFLSIHEPTDSPPLGFRPESDRTQGALSRLDPWAMLPAVSGPVRFRLNVEDVSHPVLSLADGETNGLRWANLGLLEGSGKFFSGVKPGSRVLAVEPVNGGPVLAERTVGRGRVLGLANTTSWRWALDGGRRGEGPADYQRFWEKTIRWLAGSPGSGSLRLVRPEGVLSTHDSWPIRIHAPPHLGRPPRLWVVLPDGKRREVSVRASERKGEYTADFVPAEPGNYEWIAEAGEAHRDRLRLDVSAGWEESLDTRPDFARLADLAQMSGGRFSESGNVQRKTVQKWFSTVLWETRPQSLGTDIFFVALGLLALAGEWTFRRRRGLP